MEAMYLKYYDVSGASGCIGIFCKDEEVCFTGTVVNILSTQNKDDIYFKYEREYDIHFIFKDNVPVIDFYTVPFIEIFAQDSMGGLIGSMTNETDPVYYIAPDKQCYIIAESVDKFLENPSMWKEELVPDNTIRIYNSKEEAKKELDITDFSELFTES